MKNRTNQRGFAIYMFAVLFTGLGAFSITFSNIAEGNGSSDQYNSDIQHQKSVVKQMGQLLLNDRAVWNIENSDQFTQHEKNPLGDNDKLYIGDNQTAIINGHNIDYKNFAICFGCEFTEEESAIVDDCNIETNISQDKNFACIDGKKLQLEGIQIVRKEMEKIADRARFLHTAIKQSGNADCDGQCNYFQEMQECGFDIGCETQVASSSNGNIDGTHLIVNEFETWNSSTADVKLQYEWGKNGNMDNFELIANGPLGLQVVEVVAINS